MLVSKTSSHMTDVPLHSSFTSHTDDVPASPPSDTCSFQMSEDLIQIMTDELMLDGNLASPVTTTTAINNNYLHMDEYPDSVYNWIIIGWALTIFFLGLVTFTFPCSDIHDYHSNEAFITYIVMLILDVGIWIPMWIHISPPKGHLKKIKYFLHASFVFFNPVSNILEQIISSVHYLNHGTLLIFINLFCGALSFFIISALFWLAIDLIKEGSS